MTSPLFQGVACQVSSAIVSAVSALTYQLGKQLAPIVVEQGSKVFMIFYSFPCQAWRIKISTQIDNKEIYSDRS